MSILNKATRREFLVAGSSAALVAATSAVSAQAESIGSEAFGAPVPELTPSVSADLFENAPQRTFSGDKATQVAMPLGGIGAGSICLNGHGGLQDFSIRTRPETSALPIGFGCNSPEAAFAVLHVKGGAGITKLVEGPFPAFKIFDQVSRGRDCAVRDSKDFRASENALSKGSTLSEKSSSAILPFLSR